MAFQKSKEFEPKITEKGTKLFLMNLSGKAYLPVNQRLVWFREVHPYGVIMTEPVTIEKDFAIFKATIAVPNSATGQRDVIATGFKKETQEGFYDYIEKSETGAIGRALALAGFGSQFEPGFDEGERLADAPVEVIGGRNGKGNSDVAGKLLGTGASRSAPSPTPGTPDTGGTEAAAPTGASPAAVNTSAPAPGARSPKSGSGKPSLVEKAKTRSDVNNLLSSVSRSIVAKKTLTIDQIKQHMVTKYGNADKAKLDDTQATELLGYLDTVNTQGLSNGATA